MNILVTGAKGFVGRNLCENLKNIRDGKNRTRPALNITDILSMTWTRLRRCWMNTAPRQTLYSTWPGSTAPKWKASSWQAISALPPPCWIH